MYDLVISSLNHTWILDLDGTVVRHNGYKLDGKDTLLPGVKEFFAQIPEGDRILFLTSREEQYKSLTESFLKENQIRYDHIIYGVPYGERILINDSKPSGLEMAKCLCLKRDEGLIDVKIVVDEKL
ncbi:MAG: HAD family acid phosphatase [Clostridium sp.]|nr:HAD family acid phosphatase [Clostridium sp.]